MFYTSIVSGLLFDDQIDALLYTPTVVAIALIVYGIFFLVLESRKRESKVNSIKELTFPKALMIGVFQILALVPGTSRSGSTILGAITIGCSREVAAEFSFFLAIPMMFGASAYKIYKYFKVSALAFSSIEMIVLATGMIVAFVVSIFAIKFLMNYIKKHDFKAFGWYRIVLGLVVIAYFLFLK